MRKVNIFLGFLCGFCLGYLFHLSLISRLNFPEIIDSIIMWSLCVVLALIYAFSIQIKCISILLLPSMMQWKGRRLIKTLLLSYIIAGPIMNVVRNGDQVIHLFLCSATLGYNFTRARYELAYQPFVKAIFAINPDSKEVDDTFRFAQSVIAPIKMQFDIDDQQSPNDTDTIDQIYLRDESDDPPSYRYQKNYLHKMKKKCDGIISGATDNCRRVFDKNLNECLNSVHWMASWLYCWPLKLNIICDVVHEFNLFGTCDPNTQVNPNLGKYYTELLKLNNSLDVMTSAVKLHYRLKQIDHFSSLCTLSEGVQLLKNDIEGKTSILLGILKLLYILLVVLSVRVMLTSQKYHDRYLILIDFDNICITKYFRKIDDRRTQAGKLAVLPLKKVEESEYFFYNSLRCKTFECTIMSHQLLRLLIEMLTASIFFMLDFIFYEALDSVREHSNFEIKEEGYHNVTFEIRGTGFVSRIVRSMIKSFNVTKEIKITKNITECLPEPTLLDRVFLYKIWLGYLFLLIFILLDVYVSRLRRVICAYFYPKREKQRVIFLYNSILRMRYKFVKQIRKTIKIIAAEVQITESLSISKALRRKYPTLFGWLKIFHGLRKCLLCGNSNSCFNVLTQHWVRFHVCPTCKFIYCIDCWRDLEAICYACE